MQRLNPPTHLAQHPAAQRQRGITLLESLVAIVVAALGILGVVGVQMRTLADTSTAARRAQAIRLIEDLGERMKVNPNALSVLGSYVSGFGNTPTVTNCATNACSQTQLVTHDLAIWKKTVADSLPSGQAEIFIPPAESLVSAPSRRQLGVMIAWRENEADGHKTDDIDATKLRKADGSFYAAAGNQASCPAEHTCHLQYLLVPARCAPYNPSPGVSGATVTFFCPGG